MDLRICHVITGLDVGGSEMMLWKLLSRLHGKGQTHCVMSLTRHGPVGDRIRELGVEVSALNLGRRVPNPWRLAQLARWIRRQAPDVVQTWLYLSDVAGGVAARLAGRAKVIWGVRGSNLDRAVNKPQTLLLARLSAGLSRRVPDRIVCCSRASREVHARYGYDERKMVVIPNGFDLERFRPDAAAADALRRQWGLSASDVAIGLFARFDPLKDHRTFFRAAAAVARARPGVRFFLAGQDITPDNAEIAGYVREAGVGARVRLLGRRDDVPAVMAAMDIVVSSSLGEGFSNVIGEAMACGVPCVVTDVGDSGETVGATGRVVRAGDAEAMAAACGELADLPREGRRALGAAARERVRQNYDLDRVAARYGSLYEEVAERVRVRRFS